MVEVEQICRVQYYDREIDRNRTDLLLYKHLNNIDLLQSDYAQTMQINLILLLTYYYTRLEGFISTENPTDIIQCEKFTLHKSVASVILVVL